MICLSLSGLPFAATLMDLEIIRLSKVSQIKKDKYHMISLYMNSKNGTSEPIYENKADP